MRWTVAKYRQHPRATPVFLLHDTEEPDGQVAVFQDQGIADAVARVLNAEPAQYEAQLRHADPHRGAF